jgi:putative transposase
MSQNRLKNVAASVRQRLLNRPREREEEHQLILERYVQERFMPPSRLASGTSALACVPRPALAATPDVLYEGFFATLECNLIERERFASHAEVRMAIVSFDERRCNPHRRHSALDYRATLTYEKLYQERLAFVSC